MKILFKNFKIMIVNMFEELKEKMSFGRKMEVKKSNGNYKNRNNTN